MALTIRGAQPFSVFRLNGADENSATFALGWVLEQSIRYRKVFIETVFNEALDVDSAAISLQRHGQGGYTDLEIQAGHRFHAILEAKLGWDVPSLEQLAQYKPRLVEAGAERKRLVSVSAADQAFALRRLPAELDGIRIVHLSWGDLQRLANQARSLASGFEEKLWLRQLIEHLREFVSMERQTDNNVFVVALGWQPMVEGQAHTWIDVVEKDKCYFHPIGINNWPPQPPNYIAFRYHGKLQSVHHIDSFDVVENVNTYNPLWLKTDSDHFVYRLGPPMRPTHDVKTGKIFGPGHVWCAIDTLLSGAYATISDARNETDRRLADLL